MVGALAELPGVERGVADEVLHAAVILRAAGLHGEVFGAGAGVLGRRCAGDDLHLVDGVHRDGLRDETVVALLADGFGGKAVEIELAEVVAGAADDGEPRAALGAGRERAEGGWIALRVVHDERKAGVGGVLDGHAERRVGRLKLRRRRC